MVFPCCLCSHAPDLSRSIFRVESDMFISVITHDVIIAICFSGTNIRFQISLVDITV